MKYKEIFYLTRFGYTPYRLVDMVTVRFRYDPVPCSGSYRCGNFYRGIKTTQELRWNYAHKDFTRGKRRKKMLPNTWDDLPRNDYRDRSWKSCTKRRKQYK